VTAGALQALLGEAPLEPDRTDVLARYGASVLETNRHFNLTGAKSPDEFVSHLLDSLTVVPYVREPFVDVGSGAGLPAIPIAIATAVPVTLIEATAKKARFLTSVLETFDLEGRVIAERAETAAHRSDLRERFASGTARAVSSAPTVAELLLPFVAIGGAAILQRGTMTGDELRALEDASLMLGGRIESEETLTDGRRILVLRKTAATPDRFPRRPGVPEKRPLCL
jgi:16S rRNA (guanine527-N7)-methyltransferase